MSTDAPELDTIIFNYPDGTEDALTFPAGTIAFFEERAALVNKSVDVFLIEDVLMPYVNDSLEKATKLV